MNCICCDVVQQGHRRLIPFYQFSMLNNSFKELWIVRLLLVNCYNNDSSDNVSLTKQLIAFITVSHRWSDLTIKATITRCDLSATILFKLVDSYLIAFKFAQ